MPIHDIGYRHWSGDWTSHPYRWWVISWQGIRMLAGRKRFMLLMVLSGLPFVVRSVMIYGATVLGRLPFLRVDAKFFEDFLTQQLFFTFIIAIYAGSGLVANDLKANALQIYLSKPITRQDYVIGKLGVISFFLSLTTVIPALLLLLLAFLFQSSAGWIAANAWLAGPIVLYSAVIVLTHAFLVLCLSSLTRSSRFAGVNLAAVFFLTQIVAGILKQILRTGALSWISLRENIIQAGALSFGRTPDQGAPPWVAMGVLVLVVAGSAWLFQRRVRAVEVVR
jgi:ABC-2 type transport system permease protein